MKDSGKRYIGLDVHKHYLIALGVGDERDVVLPIRRVELSHLETWMKKTLSRQDEVVLETPAPTACCLDRQISGNERQDRGFDPGAVVGQGFVGGDLGISPGFVNRMALVAQWKKMKGLATSATNVLSTSI